MNTVDGAPAAGTGEGADGAGAGGGRAGRRRSVAILSAAAAATVVAGATVGLGVNSVVAGAATAGPASSSSADIHTALGRSGYGGYGGYGSSSGSTGSTDSSALASATSAQEVGVVDITSELGYDQAESAGTGLVLTSTGEILTNNHVIEDATSIRVTVVATGASYAATVVGTDATDDVAVLQLSNASGLGTAHLDTAGDVALGDAVTGVGNAGGVGGTPSASPGTVTALDATITTQAEQSAASETLNGLIETDADIQAGDSGGPLFNASDEVIGIDTAASQGGETQGYAIPIEDALAIAGRIEAGQASSTITIGYPAFLGVEVAPSAASGASDPYGSSAESSGTVTGAAVSGVIEGGPASAAGLAAGDTITALNGTPIASAQALTQALGTLAPGRRVSLTWTDTAGAAHTAEVTLAQGPAA
ncbi:trypsin-like peptidase domain-containing protein [Leifsonia sp. NPDC080035]|uniref:Trypsin-like peptidase domain-containing protein n=1 Tax=Leifsonia sp. NPDC080035 TaxID=3143936 RepID=A0AAU7GD99_9MICO